MTIPYNSTVWTNSDRMKDDFSYDRATESYIYKKDNTIIFKIEDFNTLCSTLYTCLYIKFPKLNDLLKYFSKIASIANKLNLYIPWDLPSGLGIKQRYYRVNKVKFKPFLFSKDLLTISVLNKKEFNDMKQRRALMPNLVHSLDAASLAMLVDKCDDSTKSIDFFSVHDCFAVNCNNVQLIVEFLKYIYCEIYTEKDFLLNFDKRFRALIQISYPNAFIDDYNIKLLLEEDKVENLVYPELPGFIIDNKNLEKHIKNSAYIIK